MNLDLELATAAQIADELRKRNQPFILIIGNPPFTGDAVDMGMFMNAPPPVAVEIMEQATEIIRQIAENGDMPPELELE